MAANGSNTDVVAAGINCERIFKIKAVSGHRPEQDPLLVAQGFIGFKKDQAFYVLAHYPSLDAYFVSNQYAVPFGRNALCGLVPAPLFSVVDLYSSDSTKVPLPTPVDDANDFHAIAAVAVVGCRADRFDVKVAVRIPAKKNTVSDATHLKGNDAFAATSTAKTYQDFVRFHRVMLDHISQDKQRFVPNLPMRPVLDRDMLQNPQLMAEKLLVLQISLDHFLKEVLDQGFVDALSLFLLPPGFDTKDMRISDHLPNFSQSSARPVPPTLKDDSKMFDSPQLHQTAIPDSTQPLSEPAYQQPLSYRHASIPHPQRISNPVRHSSSLADKHSSNTSTDHLQQRHTSSLLTTEHRGSFPYPSDFRSSIASDTGFLHTTNRDSTASRHGSIISRASNRFSISSRRGSAMVSVLTVELDTDKDSLAAPGGVDAPPKAPVTQWAAHGPVKSGSFPFGVQEEEEEDDGQIETEEDIKKRNRNFVITGLASELEELALSASARQIPAYGGSNGVGAPAGGGSSNSRRGSEAYIKPMSTNSRRGSEAHHLLPGGLPARTSSKQQQLAVGAADAKVLAQEANLINAFFEEDAVGTTSGTGLLSHAGEARSNHPPGSGMGHKSSATSLRDGISGRSSSLGWRKE
ncbi:hypothetical protein HDU98_010845 [Podochytrium sp. JEL0797]|nr:hypothetical protein HDU98_010845 [Podochytrium sp. JEL0797]